jgi:hypothetical protein
MVIVTPTPAIISILALISLILSPAKPILLILFPNISFLVISVNPINLSHRLRYY